MPDYEFTHPSTGKKIIISGEEPPDEGTVERIFKETGGAEKVSTAKGAMIGLGAGLLSTAKGAQEAISRAASYLPIPGAEEAGKRADQRHEEKEDIKTDVAPLTSQNTGASVGMTVGGTLPYTLLPGGVIGGWARRALASAAVGGLQGQVENNNPIEGAVTGAIASLGLSGGSKVLNALAGKVPENLIQQVAKKYHIPLTLGEITGKPGTQRLETLLERAPSFLGLSNFRVKQNEAAQGAATSFLSRYIVDPGSANIKDTNRQYADGLFAALRIKVDKVPVQDILPGETRKSAMKLLDQYPDFFKRFQDTKTEGLIKNIVGDTSPTIIPPRTNPASMILGADGKPAIPSSMIPGKTIPTTFTFEDLWDLRKGLGEKIGQARQLKARGELDETAYKQLKTLFASVSTDLEQWAGKIGRPDIINDFRSANEAYKNFVVKHDIVSRAYDKAMGTVGAGELFSPKRFSTALKKIAYDNQAYKTFSEGEVQQMTGLANIMQVVKRSGQFMENPPTGNRWGGLGTTALIEGTAWKVGGVATAAKTAGTAAFATGVAKFLTTTKAGQNLALAASRLEPDSKGMRMVVDQIYKQVPRFMTGAELKESYESNMGVSP